MTRIVDHTEKEVRIFDEVNGKKVFNIFFMELDSAICLNGALTEVVELLNTLHEENQQLKAELRNLRRLANELYMEGSE